MFKYPDQFITPTSMKRTVMATSFQIKITDNVQQLTGVSGNNVFGFQGNGNAKGLKAVLPPNATIINAQLYNNAAANTSGTGAAAQLVIGRAIPFISITAAGTTATVKCPYAHMMSNDEVIHVSDTGVAGFNTVGTNNTIQNQQPKTITPSSTDPTVFTYTISSTTATATAGLIVCTSYFVNSNVLSGGLATGFQNLAIHNIGSFDWTGGVAAYLSGAPGVWSVSGKMDPNLGGDGNYNYFIEPGLDCQIFGYFQEYATSGFSAATSGGPWTVFIQYVL